MRVLDFSLISSLCCLTSLTDEGGKGRENKYSLPAKSAGLESSGQIRNDTQRITDGTSQQT